MTGCFASESELPDKLEWLTSNYSRFEPREWVMKNMSAQRATELLGESILRVALARGEQWTQGPVVKVNRLHDMAYWDASDRERFEADYVFLRTALRDLGRIATLPTG
jgi:hypothetical protein